MSLKTKKRIIPNGRWKKRVKIWYSWDDKSIGNKANFIDIAEDVTPGYWNNNKIPENKGKYLDLRIFNTIIKKQIKPGDIIFVGSTYESRQTYGMYFVRSPKPGDYRQFQSTEIFEYSEDIADLHNNIENELYTLGIDGHVLENINYDDAIRKATKFLDDNSFKIYD